MNSVWALITLISYGLMLLIILLHVLTSGPKREEKNKSQSKISGMLMNPYKTTFGKVRSSEPKVTDESLTTMEKIRNFLDDHILAVNIVMSILMLTSLGSMIMAFILL